MALIAKFVICAERQSFFFNVNFAHMHIICVEYSPHFNNYDMCVILHTLSAFDTL